MPRVAGCPSRCGRKVVVQLPPVARLDVLPGAVLGEGGFVAQGPRWRRGVGRVKALLRARQQRKARRHCWRQPLEKLVHRWKSPKSPTSHSSAGPRAADARASSGLSKRPQWVRCFEEDAPGRPRESSVQGRRSQETRRTRGRAALECRRRRSPAAPQSRTRSTGCTCPGSIRHGGAATRRHGRAARAHVRLQREHVRGHGREREHGRRPRGPSSAAGFPCPRRTARTTWRLPSHPGRGAARPGSPGARCAGVSRQGG
jgi:hypothetical protein